MSLRRCDLYHRSPDGKRESGEFMAGCAGGKEQESGNSAQCDQEVVRFVDGEQKPAVG